MLKIGIVADCKKIGSHAYHVVGDKYLRAISEGMKALPIPIPASPESKLFGPYLQEIDGLLLTGSHSNIEPYRYGAERVMDALHDPARDSTTLPLITMSVDADIPVFGICRGFQEINVAFGGSLHQRVQELPGMMDHREDSEQPLNIQYGPAHDIIFEEGSMLRQVVGEDTISVNSIHQQGIWELGKDLVIEARASDGLIEAFRLNRKDRFVFGVQWHPEWQAKKNHFYQSIFDMFRRACDGRAD